MEFGISNKESFLRPTGFSTFTPTSCPNRRTLRLKCFPSECGLRPFLETPVSKPYISNISGDIALPGEWPWQVVLLKEGLHVCDGTLVSPQWVLTAASCFEGSNMPPKTPWTVRLGALRPTGSQHPWMQESSLIGVVTSSSGSFALSRLSDPVIPDNYIGTVCLPETGSHSTKGDEFFSLIWGNKGDRLESVKLNVTTCHNNGSEPSNLICAIEGESSGKQYCQDTGLPGKPLFLHSHHDSSGKKKQRWTIVGVDSGRRIGNGKAESVTCAEWVFEGVRQSLDWIKHTTQGISEAGENAFAGGG
ncbi:hypothetical protein J437_LFUL010803 [Ladona fulva]|uniref:Peptidase S1 domain-containing protein n=1 Tax=Ladona fulva TaxID=123851 RepID=A0A8K0KVK2_LADFU|nr:hypothetical protein J437_LFUL010803 [Ladona fulva]